MMLLMMRGFVMFMFLMVFSFMMFMFLMVLRLMMLILSVMFVFLMMLILSVMFVFLMMLSFMRVFMSFHMIEVLTPMHDRGVTTSIYRGVTTGTYRGVTATSTYSGMPTCTYSSDVPAICPSHMSAHHVTSSRASSASRSMTSPDASSTNTSPYMGSSRYSSPSSRVGRDCTPYSSSGTARSRMGCEHVPYHYCTDDRWMCTYTRTNANSYSGT
jgi:hypothetical protein